MFAGTYRIVKHPIDKRWTEMRVVTSKAKTWSEAA
jgi:hypothetical protein